MDENVLFKPGQQEQENQSGQSPEQQAQPDNQQASDANIAPDTQQAVVEQPTADQMELESSPPPPPPAGPMGFITSHWKKLLIGIGIIVLLIFFINLMLPKNESTQHVKLTWWGLWEDSPSVQALILDFKKSNPNIDVEYVKRAPQDYRERLLTRIDSGNGPDIFRYHNTWVPMLGDKLLPLSVDVITPEDFKSAYYPVIQHDLMVNNGIVGIPLGVDSLAMFVNPDLFADAGVQVPTTWDDFRKATKELTVKDNSTGKIKQAGAALGTFNNIKHASDILSLLFVQQGVAMDTFTGTEKSKIDALDFYTSFARGENNVWDPTLDNSLLAFSKGTVAVYFGYSWDVFAIQKLNKDFKFKVYPVPSLSKSTTIASYWVEGVSSKSKYQKEAFAFMKYLAQKETAQKFYTESSKSRAFGEPYARKDLRESLREEPLVYPFVSQLDDASSTIFSSDTHDGDTGMNSVLNKYLENTVNGVINDGDSAESSIEALENGVAQTLEKYGITRTQ